MSLHFFLLFIDLSKVFLKSHSTHLFILDGGMLSVLSTYMLTSSTSLLTGINSDLFDSLSFLALIGDMLSKRRTLRYAQSIQNVDLAYIDCIHHLITAIRRDVNSKSLLVVVVFFGNNLTL